MSTKIILTCLILMLGSCANPNLPNSGYIEEKVYRNEYLHWTLYLPDKFQFISDADRQRWAKNTKKALETDYKKSTDQINLISFKLSESCVLVGYLNSKAAYPHLSSESDFFEAAEIPMKKGMLKRGFKPKFSYQTERIDGQLFHVQNIDITSPTVGNINHQKNFLRFDNKYMLQIMTSWSTEEEKKAILEILRGSKFTD